jgi:hypothetical protein
MPKKEPESALEVLLDWQLDNAEKLGVMDREAWNDLQRRIEEYAKSKSRRSQKAA